MRVLENQVLILGGGLTGLAAGFVLSEAGAGVAIFEGDSAVGGISKTIGHRGFRFDLGGHRFFTNDERIDSFVRNLMKGELISVPRSSKIFMRGKYFDYPLKPLNALFGMGIPATAGIFLDYGIERMKRLFREPAAVSLEDWVVARFGRTMFDIYFKEYSEKVWGIDCSRISARWVDQRISGLSLTKAAVNAFFKKGGRKIPTLVDRFVYPRLGIGRISEVLAENIEKTGSVFTGTKVERIFHAGGRIASIAVNDHGQTRTVQGNEFISSLPVTSFVKMMDPSPPGRILFAASNLGFRDLVIVALMINRPRVTDQTWIYIPERKIPFGRIHEPANWSDALAPDGMTSLVLEFFSFKGDGIWNAGDDDLIETSVYHLERLGFIRRREVMDGVVVRVPNAYPLFEVGHEKHFEELASYLSRFENLHTAGRAGMFRYYNMDHAIRSGMSAAEKILSREYAAAEVKTF